MVAFAFSAHVASAGDWPRYGGDAQVTNDVPMDLGHAVVTSGFETGNSEPLGDGESQGYAESVVQLNLFGGTVFALAPAQPPRPKGERLLHVRRVASLRY